MRSITLGSPAGKWLMASTILASSMAFIDATALNVVLPSLQQDLHAKSTQLFWILNAYLLMLAALILIGGTLGDKLGRRKVFMIGIIIFMTGSIACGLSPGVYWLIASRFLQGIGGACMIPGSLSLISASFSDKERGKAIGTWSAITTVVTIGGPILGGFLGDAGLWRFIFFINVPIGIASLLILWRKVAESKDEDTNATIDYGGAVTTVVGLALLSFGFLRIPETGIRDTAVYLSLAGGIVSLTIFFFIERKKKYPMVPFQLFANKTFSGANLLTFFLYAALSEGMLFITLNMVQLQGYKQVEAGLSLLPFTICMVLISRLAGSLADKYGPRWLLVCGPAAAGIGFLVLSFQADAGGVSSYWTDFFPGITVFGLGMSFTVAPLTATVMGAVPNHFSGTASGINNAITRIAGVFAIAIIGALAVLHFSHYLQDSSSIAQLGDEARAAIMREAADLGNAKVPDVVSDINKPKIENLYQQGFAKAYQLVMRICAALALLASCMSFVFIKNIQVDKRS